MSTTVAQPSRPLPVFPWDRLEPYKATAAAHPDGIVDLSVGTPVDPVPEVSSGRWPAPRTAPGYPTVWGTPELRAGVTGWVGRRLGAAGLTDTHVLPVVGSKELVAWLPTQLGLGAGDKVALPAAGLPDVRGRGAAGGRRAGRLRRADRAGPGAGCGCCGSTRPSNPTGRVLPRRTWP